VVTLLGLVGEGHKSGGPGLLGAVVSKAVPIPVRWFCTGQLSHPVASSPYRVVEKTSYRLFSETPRNNCLRCFWSFVSSPSALAEVPDWPLPLRFPTWSGVVSPLLTSLLRAPVHTLSPNYEPPLPMAFSVTAEGLRWSRPSGLFLDLLQDQGTIPCFVEIRFK